MYIYTDANIGGCLQIPPVFVYCWFYYIEPFSIHSLKIQDLDTTIFIQTILWSVETKLRALYRGFCLSKQKCLNQKGHSEKHLPWVHQKVLLLPQYQHSPDMPSRLSQWVGMQSIRTPGCFIPPPNWPFLTWSSLPTWPNITHNHVNDL